LQQFRAARHELEKFRSEAEAGEKSNAVARARLQELEAALGKLQIRLQSAEIQEKETLQQLEASKTQRSAYLWETNRLEGEFLEATRRIAFLEREQKELNFILERASQQTEALNGEGLTLKGDLEQKSARLSKALEELAFKEKALEKAEAELEQHHQELLASRDAAHLKSAETRIAELQECMGEVVVENSRLREKFRDADRDRAILTEENLNIRLQLAATREALGDAQLHQENELLRGVIERTNEQIRVLSNASARVRFMHFNEILDADEPESNRSSSGLRWLQGLLAKWGHST
jgi:chromosome segregation ATPase